MSTRTLPSVGRVAWVDVAKGISILLIVNQHASHWLGYIGLDAAWVDEFNRIFASMRLPLFFFVAGIFAAKWLTKPLAELWDRKVSTLLWLYLLWQPVVFAYKLLAASTLPGQQDATLAAHLLRAVASPVRPSGELWFLWALAIYFVVARLLRRVPVWILLAAGIVASAGWQWLTTVVLSDDTARLLGPGLLGLPEYFVFFAAGLLLRRQVFVAVAGANAWVIAGVLAVWLALSFAGAHVNFPGEWVLLRLLGLAAGVALACALSWARPLEWLGSRTLQVYLAHTLFIVLIVVGIHALGVPEAAWAGSVAPFAITLVVVALSLLLHRIVSPGPLRHLYRKPRVGERVRAS